MQTSTIHKDILRATVDATNLHHESLTRAFQTGLEHQVLFNNLPPNNLPTWITFDDEGFLILRYPDVKSCHRAVLALLPEGYHTDNFDLDSIGRDVGEIRVFGPQGIFPTLFTANGRGDAIPRDEIHTRYSEALLRHAYRMADYIQHTIDNKLAYIVQLEALNPQAKGMHIDRGELYITFATQQEFEQFLHAARKDNYTIVHLSNHHTICTHNQFTQAPIIARVAEGL